MTHTAATPTEVRDITGSTLADAAIQPFLDAAACAVGQVEDCAVGVSDTCKTMAESYLAAHLLTTSTVGQSSATVKKESLRGKYSVEYLSGNATGQGVLGTTYGQTANMLLAGCLAELDKSPARIWSIGSIC